MKSIAEALQNVYFSEDMSRAYIRHADSEVHAIIMVLLVCLENCIYDIDDTIIAESFAIDWIDDCLVVEDTDEDRATFRKGEGEEEVYFLYSL